MTTHVRIAAPKNRRPAAQKGSSLRAVTTTRTRFVPPIRTTRTNAARIRRSGAATHGCYRYLFGVRMGASWADQEGWVAQARSPSPDAAAGPDCSGSRPTACRGNEVLVSSGLWEAQ